jgi:hypothetical protein
MRHARTWLTAAALLVAACQAAPAPKAPAPDAERKVAAPRGGSTATQATAAAGGESKLVRPPAGTRLLGGTVRVDAAYMAGTGAGRLVGADGATLVGADGATAIAAAGAPLVAAGKGNAIAPLRPDAGGGLIGPDGASVVSAGGGSLIGADGASLVGADGASYTLAQADSGLLPGQALPAAGMMVAAISLADDKPVSVGRDADGQPVYAVYTDAEGKYQIYPPEEAHGNLRVVALAGGKDARLRYGALADPSRAEKRDVSEAATTAARYVHLCILSQLDGFLRKGKVTRIEVALAAEQASTGMPQPANAGIARLEAAAAAIGYEQLPASTRDALLRRIGDIALADLDLTKIRMEDPPGLAMDVIEDRLEKGAQQVAELMASPPAGKTAATMFADVAELTVNGVRSEILRPADFNEFIVTRYIAIDPLDSAVYVDRIHGLRLRMGLPVAEGPQTDLGAAGYALAIEIGFHLFGVDGTENGTWRLPVVSAIEAAMQGFDQD